MSAYYNEIDPFAAEWLRELIKAGMIAPGEVDERSIEDVLPADIRGFSQHHFFAGIGVWSYALRQAGWSDDRPVWTGSCPCQPFSAAGKGAGFADERHLWPALHWLISQVRPVVVFGEQVASKDGLAWLDLVQTDMEGSGYAFGAIDSCAAGFGAPHIRQRLYWVGDSMQRGRESLAANHRSCGAMDAKRSTAIESCDTVYGALWLADTERDKEHKKQQRPAEDERERSSDGTCGRGMAGERWTSPTNGFWRDADWLYCRDGKWRPVSASPQPLVDGSAESLGRVCDACVREVEEEINATAMEAKIDPDEALRDLWRNLVAETRPKWPTGRIPGLHEAPFLLSFMRQLAEQGWRFKECVPVPREEASQETVRVLRSEHGTSCPPHRHELAQQHGGKHSNALCLLSSILARHAHTAWGNAHSAYAESCFPLVHGAPNRAGRLRGYGNAIVAPQAQAFIKAFMEITK